MLHWLLIILSSSLYHYQRSATISDQFYHLVISHMAMDFHGRFIDASIIIYRWFPYQSIINIFVHFQHLYGWFSIIMVGCLTPHLAELTIFCHGGAQRGSTTCTPQTLVSSSAVVASVAMAELPWPRTPRPELPAERETEVELFWRQKWSEHHGKI